MRTILIPKTPASAYDDTRPASDLLRAHVENLEKAVHGKRRRSAATGALTEGEAARYIRQLGRQLHQKELLPTVTVAPTIGQRPPESSAAKEPEKKKTGTRGRKTSAKNRKSSGRARTSRRSTRAKR